MRTKLYAIIGSVCFLALCAGKPALALDMTFPLDCEYGHNCFISNYFDHNSEGRKAEDYTCGVLAEDGSTSTDITLQSYGLMKRGVGVRSADEGVVKAVRDGMDDVSVKQLGLMTIRGRECGNGVIIEHKRGYETQYCHLMKQSIMVKPGDKLEKGELFARVGLSGATDFPHLQFTVKRYDVVFDPFVGEDAQSCGARRRYPYWDRMTQRRLEYIPTSLLSAGFFDKVLHAEGAREGKFSKDTISPDAEMLAFWVDMFGLQKGDTLTMAIIDPDGQKVVEEERLMREQKRHHFQFIGEKRTLPAWKVGDYNGLIRVVRTTSLGEGRVRQETVVEQNLPMKVQMP